MASSPQISVPVRTVAPINPEIVNPANGQKPPWFKSATRRTRDRDYVPDYTIILAE